MALEVSIWPKPPRGAFQRAGRLLWGEICGNKAERLVRVRSETPATPSPDTGGADASEPPASIIVNNYYCVGDDSRLVAERREFLARQRAQRPGAGAQGGYPTPAGSERHTEALSNWAALSQAVFFRNVQRWRCRELQKLWESCMKLKRRLETHPWEQRGTATGPRRKDSREVSRSIVSRRNPRGRKVTRVRTRPTRTQ